MLPIRRIRFPTTVSEGIFKNTCANFYNTTTNGIKNKESILTDFKCQKSKSGSNLLYFKKNEDEYDRVYKDNLTSCITNYNNNFDPNRMNPGNTPLSIDDFLTSCSETTFTDINPDFQKLLNYSEELMKDADVDEKVKNFINDLLMYTNINFEGLQELYKGAFVIIRDNGFFYNKFKCNGRVCDLTKMIAESSHDSKDPQLRLGEGILYNCSEEGECLRSDPNESSDFFDLLIGTSLVPIFYGDTWFQFEYANIVTAYNKYALHAVSTAKHIATKKNVGPFGESIYAEYERPLILEICKNRTCQTSVLFKTIQGVETDCDVPIECVRTDTNLESDSTNFLEKNHIVMKKYKIIKDVIKKLIKASERETLTNVKDKIIDYFHKAIDAISITNMQAMMPYLDNVSEIDNYKYTREEIIGIMFLIFDYSKVGNRNYQEIVEKIDKRYSKTRTTGGKTKRKTNKNKRKTNKNKRKTNKNKRKTNKNKRRYNYLPQNIST